MVEEDKEATDGLLYKATATFKDENGVYITYRLMFNPVTKKAAVIEQFEAGRLPKDSTMALIEAKKDLVVNVFDQQIKKENV